MPEHCPRWILTDYANVLNCWVYFSGNGFTWNMSVEWSWWFYSSPHSILPGVCMLDLFNACPNARVLCEWCRTAHSSPWEPTRTTHRDDYDVISHDLSPRPHDLMCVNFLCFLELFHKISVNTRLHWTLGSSTFNFLILYLFLFYCITFFFFKLFLFVSIDFSIFFFSSTFVWFYSFIVFSFLLQRCVAIISFSFSLSLFCSLFIYFCLHIV